MNYKVALWLSWFGFAAFLAGFGYAQVTRGPEMIPGCIVSTGFSATSGQSLPLTCDTTGKLRTGAS